MSWTRKFFALALPAACFAGCSGGDVAGPGAPLQEAGSVAGSVQAMGWSVADVGGDWTWSNVEVLRMPPFVVAMLGIGPEGPNTHARCESAGTMILVQAGTEFSGSATRTFNACETKGGQPFQQPGVDFAVTDGRISGTSARFSFSSPFVTPCPHRAVISVGQGGVALALSGTGRCVLPGHPKSGSPMSLDPPPGGTSTTTSWSAVRLEGPS